jgi:hypothetical protein
MGRVGGNLGFQASPELGKFIRMLFDESNVFQISDFDTERLCVELMIWWSLVYTRSFGCLDAKHTQKLLVQSELWV